MQHTPSAPSAPSAPSVQIGQARVTRKLHPSSRGALKLARQYGSALVCVRHRVDGGGLQRYTTVELLVDTSPIAPRSLQTVGVRIGVPERDLQAAARGAGARWDAASKLWRMPKGVAILLRLADRIVKEK